MTARASRMSFMVVLAVASACAAPQKKDLSKFVSANPRSIVVVPVVNKTIDVDAADYFLSTLPVPLAERGYYVFPVNMVKRLLEDDGLSDASVVHAAALLPNPPFAPVRLADAVDQPERPDARRARCGRRRVRLR